MPKLLWIKIYMRDLRTMLAYHRKKIDEIITEFDKLYELVMKE